jgi:hypothetical protein
MAGNYSKVNGEPSGVELSSANSNVTQHTVAAHQMNPTHKYMKSKGHLSKQFPTIANPAPLGLCAFALTTFVLSMMNAGVIVDLRVSSEGVVCGLALFYGGLVQLLAGMWEFQTGNTLGAVAFSSYGAFWMSFAALFLEAFGFLAGYTSEEDLNKDLGIYLLSWAIFSLFMCVVSHRTTVVLFTLFWLVFVTFLLLSIGRFCGNDMHLKRAGGCFGIMAAFLAWYCALAKMLTEDNSLFHLPVGELDEIYEKWGWIPPKQKAN